MKASLKKILSACCMLFITQCMIAQSKITHGFNVNGGMGSIHGIEILPGGIIHEVLELNGTGYIDYKYNLALGYKLRIHDTKKPIFYDLDILLGMKTWEFDYHALTKYEEGGYFAYYGGSGDMSLFYLSLNPTLNYKIYKRFYSGIGVEPTLLFDSSSIEYMFDIPVVAKVGYNFKFLDVSFGYKHGLLTTIEYKDDFSKGKTNEWYMQCSILF